jgi:hypothetical protein
LISFVFTIGKERGGQAIKPRKDAYHSTPAEMEADEEQAAAAAAANMNLPRSAMVVRNSCSAFHVR